MWYSFTQQIVTSLGAQVKPHLNPQPYTHQNLTANLKMSSTTRLTAHRKSSTHHHRLPPLTEVGTPSGVGPPETH